MDYKIKTSHIQPPIPTTRFDWCAVWVDLYDDSESGTDHPIGNGKTELEAISALIEDTPENYLQ